MPPERIPSSTSISSLSPDDEFCNSKWVLKQRPSGLFQPESDVELVKEPLRGKDGSYLCGDDEIIIETSHLSIDAFIRTMLDADAYHGSVEIGGTMPALGYGEIVHAGSKTKMKVGSYVAGMFGAQTHSTCKANSVFPMMKFPCLPLKSSLGLMSLSCGLTAYAGVFYVCKPPRKGDTVVITAAAGAVGSIASQLAKSTGARVIGVAGGKKKGSYLVNDLGLDGALDYKDDERTLDEQLDDLCPDGIDFLYDNVGGGVLNTLMGRINTNGRIIICGAISQYGKQRGTAIGPSNYIKLAERGAMMKGFNAMQYMTWKLPFMLCGMFYLYMRGKVKMTEHIDIGIASYPTALHKLFTGGHIGKLLVQVKPDSSSKKDD